MLFRTINHLIASVCIIALSLWLFTACQRLEKDIDVTLPAYEKQLAVECYLEPGIQPRLLLTETSGYFDGLSDPTVSGANVKITSPQRTFNMFFSFSPDSANNKIYNYASTDKIEPRIGDTFVLEVSDAKGRKLTGTTTYLPKPVIDSIEMIRPAQDSLGNIIIDLVDDGKAENYYRVIMNIDSLNGRSEIDFVFEDKLFNGKKYPIRTRPRFKINQKVYVRIYNIEKPYYDYIRSVSGARQANGNPFAQPVTLKSTVQGGVGVFAALSYSMDSVLVR